MLSMPHSRKLIHKQDEVAERLRSELKAKGLKTIRRKTKRDRLIEAAKSGRPADLAEQARASLAARRTKRALDMIAGRSA